MRHRLEPGHHSRNRFVPGRIDHVPVRLHDSDHIKQILDKCGVIHGAALEVSAVGEDLLGDFGVHQGEPLSQPSLRFPAGKIKADKDQCFRVGKNVIALQVRLDAPT